ncbi:MAG: hypothetical protein QG622_416 [Actinomycetota bacterium]|nr:hypothetical protein [Actinomycetota bacterium]
MADDEGTVRVLLQALDARRREITVPGGGRAVMAAGHAAILPDPFSGVPGPGSGRAGARDPAREGRRHPGRRRREQALGLGRRRSVRA